MAAAGVLSYSVRDSFSSYQTLSAFTPRTYTTMSQSPGSNIQQRHSATSNTDSTRMSLPSISNLLGIADASRPDSSQGYEQSHSKRPRYDQGYQRPEPTSNNILATQDPSAHHRNASAYAPYSPVMDAPSSASTSAYPMEVDHQSAGGSKAAYSTSPYSIKPYAASPSAASDGSVYSPNAMMHRQVGVYSAQGMQPGYIQSETQSSPNLPATNPWEHHHYISSSAQQGIYPPLPDRYICQTCNKAFSRPSSLKIHSHSHTGEKPFRCPHAGCGKAFSVKSNMKRHEKGCHTSTGQAIPEAYMGDEA